MTFETVKLSEVADIIVGFAFKSQDFNTDGNGVRLVRGKNITKRSLRWGEDTRWWSDFSIDLNRYFLKENDIVIGMDGSLVGKNYAKIKESDLPLLLVQRVACIRAKKGISQEYLWQIIATPVFEKYIDAVKTGTTIPHISGKQIGEYEIPYVDYETQLKISGILSSIEERVLLNTAINENLEQQLSCIYHSFFQNDTVCELGCVVETTSGGTPSRKKEDYYGGKICWVKSKELQGSYIIDTEEKITEKGLSNSSAKLIPANSVLIAMYGATVGEYGIISKPMTCNQAICALIPNENYPYSFLYMFAKVNKKNFINLAVGSAQQNISQVLIKRMPICSDVRKIHIFHDSAASILEQIRILTIENQHLYALRDTLLPKLMNGEIDVSAVKI